MRDMDIRLKIGADGTITGYSIDPATTHIVSLDNITAADLEELQRTCVAYATAKALLEIPPSNTAPVPTALYPAEDGSVTMAMLAGLGETADELDLRLVACAHGYQARRLALTDDPFASDALISRYERSEPVLPDWHPTFPDPTERYTLATKIDTEDGPVAWFIRPYDSPAEQRADRIMLAQKVLAGTAAAKKEGAQS